MPALQRGAAWAEERLLGALRRSVPQNGRVHLHIIDPRPPLFSGTLSGHSGDISGPKGPRDSCSRSGGSQAKGLRSGQGMWGQCAPNLGCTQSHPWQGDACPEKHTLLFFRSDLALWERILEVRHFLLIFAYYIRIWFTAQDWILRIWWGSNFHPLPQPQNSLLRIFHPQPGLERKFLLRRIWSGQKLLHCSFQDFHSLSKENQVSLLFFKEFWTRLSK